MKISIPMAMRIIPPRIPAFLLRCVPAFLPIASPAMQIAKVTTQIMREETNAMSTSYSAVVKPTESASIDVAIPWIISVLNLSFSFSFSDSLSSCKASIIILIPMYIKRPSAVHGTKK